MEMHETLCMPIFGIVGHVVAIWETKTRFKTAFLCRKFVILRINPKQLNVEA